MNINGKQTNMGTVLSAFFFFVILFEGIFTPLLPALLPINNTLGVSLLKSCVLVILNGNIVVDQNLIILLFCIYCGFVITIFQELTATKMEYLIYFFSFGLAGILCSCKSIDVNKVFCYSTSMTIFVTIIFIVRDWYIIDLDYFSFGYMMIPGILCILLYIYELACKREFFKAAMLGLFDCYLLKITLSNCGRGIYVCVGVFVFLSCLLLSRHISVKIFCWCSAAVGTLMLFNISKILFSFQNFMLKNNIHVYALEKTMRLLLRTGDISNGRSQLYAQVFSGLDLGQILFGRGIGEYEKLYGIYTHNLFLSVFSDFGILGILILTILCISVGKAIIRADKKERYIYILLLSVCFTKLMLSSVYWKSSGFWVLIGLALRNVKWTKKIKII